MVKLLILPMDIRQEMLGSLRQVKNCLQIDNLSVEAAAILGY